jgi:hypothetical protein
MRFVGFRAPLSGDVLQAINPWNLFIRSLGQVGLININIGRTPAPDVEEQVLDEVGSYGRQIGRLAEALEVVIDRVLLAGEPKLDRAQWAAIHAFRAQLDEVKAIKRRAGRS